MAVTREDVFTINLENVVQTRLDSFVNVRERIRAREEAGFQRRIIDSGLSFNDQLTYKKEQLETERAKNYPDVNFITSIESEISILKKSVRQKAFRDKYYEVQKDRVLGNKSLRDELNFLQGEFNSTFDEETKDVIKTRILEVNQQIETNDKTITDAQIDFFEKDKTIISIDKAIEMIKNQMAKPEVINNPEIFNAYDFKLQATQKYRQEVGVEDKLNDLAFESLKGDKNYVSLYKLNSLNNFIAGADNTTPVRIENINYASEREYWQTTFNNYVQNQFAAEFAGEVKGYTSRIKSSQGFLPDFYISDVSTKLKELKSNPNLIPFVNFIAQSLEHSLDIYLKSLTPFSQKRETFLSLSEISKQTPYSSKYLNLLARQGKLEAHKQGRNWLTTKEAVERYIKDRKRNRKINSN